MATRFLNADTGNDTTGTGTALLPWKTISKAHTASTSGDTIICQDSVTPYLLASQTFTKNLAIQGLKDDGSGAIFDAANANSSWTLQANFSVSKVTFRNMSVGSSTWPGSLMNFSVDNLTINFDHCVFENIVIGGRTSFTNNGLITLNSAASNCSFSFTSNLIKGTVRSNSLNTLGLGYLFNLRGLANSQITIDQNTMHISNQTGWSSIGWIMEFASTTGSEVRVRNNIFFSEEDIAVALANTYSTPSYIEFSNNCRYGSYTQVPPSTGSITSDPLFVSVADENYNLRPSSPCIDTGKLV